MTITFEVFGWIGAFILLFAYYLSMSKKDDNNEAQLSMLNLMGSLLLMANAIYFKVYPFVLMNAFWAIISIRVLVKLKNAKKANA